MDNLASLHERINQAVADKVIGQCPACGGENGQHKHLSIPYPWPMQLCMFKVVPCPATQGVTVE